MLRRMWVSVYGALSGFQSYVSPPKGDAALVRMPYAPSVFLAYASVIYGDELIEACFLLDGWFNANF